LRVNAKEAESLLGFAEQTVPGLRGLDGKTVSGQLEQRYGELLAALHWFIDQGRKDEALRLASLLAPFWMATKRLGEGSEWSDRATESAGGSDANRGETLFQAGLLAFWRGDDERASELHNSALRIGRDNGDPSLTAKALTGLARIALRKSGVGEARRLCREALAITEGTADRVGRSNALHVLGVTAQMAGEFLEARTLMTERIALGRETGNFAVIAIEASNLAMVERQLGNLDQAEALSREALEISHRRGDEWATPLMMAGLAAVSAQRGELDRAATLIGAAEEMMAAQGFAWPPDERPHYERVVSILAGAKNNADLERVRAAGRAMTRDAAVDFALGARS
jgi:tetratricopeptide (TPR) repeat protein